MKRMCFLSVVLVLLGIAPLAWAGAGEIVTGTGNFTSVVTITAETLEPSCVQLITRLGTVEFSGFITNALENSQFESWTLADACAVPPVQGTFQGVIRLEAAPDG